MGEANQEQGATLKGGSALTEEAAIELSGLLSRAISAREVIAAHLRQIEMLEGQIEMLEGTIHASQVVTKREGLFRRARRLIVHAGLEVMHPAVRRAT